MNQKKLSLCMLIFCFITKLTAQEFNAIILDSLDQKPVVAAHISSSKTGIGTITNENGAFAFTNFLAGDTLIISHIGYETIKIPFNNPTLGSVNTFCLVPDMVVLNEVVVSNDVVSDIVRKVISQLEKSTITYGKAFYRQTSFKSEKPTEWIEAFYDLSYSQKRCR